MTSPVRFERHDDVLVIISDSPPVNALGAGVRDGLKEGVSQGINDPAVKAMVIRCDGKTFFAGADITEFGKPPKGASLHEVIDMMDSSEKPIVAAIHGTALGGGCEVALACHYRVAVPSAVMGLPEVKLGLLPGAGGTQRLPRIVGVKAALEMVAIGDPIPAKNAAEVGLVDRVVGEDSLEADAIAFAREIADKKPIPRVRDKTVAPDPEAVEEFKKKHGRRMRGFDAPAANIACVVAASELPFDEGMKFEREQFMKLMTGTQSAAQRHLFFAERQAAKIDDVDPKTPLRPINKVGVIGAGTMGGGISMNFLSAGIPVTIVEMQQEALDRGTGVMRKNYEASAAKGRIKPDAPEKAMGLLTPTLKLEDLADCDLIIEAVYENMDVKKELFTKLDAIAKPGAILATNTSYLNVDEIAAVTKRPEDVVGMHFFSPANVMRLLEVVRGEKTAKDVLATVMALAKKIKKVAVVAGVCHGFIGNRMLSPRQIEANKLLMEGATPQQIDKVHVEFGMPMGPFQMADLAGVDIGWHRDPSRIESIRDALAAEGRWGQKKGAGYYDYDEKRNATPSPRALEIIEEFRAKSNLPKREITDQEIVERTLYTMVNEGALILEEGKAQRASDVDVVWIMGYGWPVYRGGPMFWAQNEVGLKKIVEGLEKHGFKVAESLKTAAETGAALK
ncbi:3-hydroxyacyl-CoA dehydrogenase NAD-binding domain-containing protein [Sphingomonas sp. Ag1]|jgi:3-hydroxyacyl-CoA dehydrogenase|uniref:3-hydroxyacyl-CoA dehydrogenase NAD-binding domain-containing protein n=1 Tax=Sphingomonas sp. Ag1 TaxID=1642949 RepID=UPI0006227CBE|nr:3-hydroxyacyl-CoA dehydrogenase NAD-binding domain-containing protein [Sphingomonas sp. Ag1]KKI17413.1 3-hydroxyacyl-CoA dehydrogenase [Sphingomonas sp. Ag1]